MPRLGLADNVAIVTGASRGIGRAIAERLARDGASVVVNFSHSADQAKDVVAAIEAAGGRALAIRADVAELNEVRELFRETHAQLGRVDILVNNAATAAHGPIADATEREFDRVFALNARGPFFAMQEAARVLPRGGRIINISSGATTVGFPNQSIYCGSKAALEQFSLVCANELGSRGITVNTVLVGMTQTEMLEGLLKQQPAFRDLVLQRTPLGRIGQPLDIAHVVAFLASEDAGWVTGQSLRADGGAR